MVVIARVVGITGVCVALVLGLGSGAAAANQPAATGTAAAQPGATAAPAGGAIGTFDVVTAAQIAAAAATDLKTALALVPTLLVEDTGGPAGRATLSLRGSTSRQVLVLVDGHRVSRATTSDFDLNDLAVPIERIERIEVVPAPASVMYGPDAVGGVVNIVTRVPGLTPAIAIAYGRGADADQRIAGGLQYGFRKLALRVDGQLRTGDGRRENSDADNHSYVVGMAVAPAPWGLDVRWTSLQRESGVPGPASLPSPQARQRDGVDGLRADVSYVPGSGWDFKAGVFTRSQSLRFTDPAPPPLDPLVPSTPIATRYENSSNGVEAHLDFDTRRGEFYTVGAEWVSDRVKSGSEEDYTAERWGLYTQDQWRNGDWSAVLGLRRDEHSVYGGRTNPSLTVEWGNGGWRLWGAWARTFRAPDFDELHLDRQFTQGNPDLAIETSEGFDGGLELKGASGHVRVSAFRRSVTDLIRWADPDGDLVYRTENVAQATVGGWEAQVLYRPSPTIAIPVGYQSVSTEDDETHESLPGTMQQLWRAAIQGDAKSLSWSLEYVATDRGDYQQRDGAWTFAVVNAALSWRDTIGSVPFRVSVRGENLRDEAHESVEGYPLGGRTWFAEVTVGL